MRLFSIPGRLSIDVLRFCSGSKRLNRTGAVKTAMTAVSGGLLLIYLFIITYVFPLQARFYNPVKRTLFNALFYVRAPFVPDYRDTGH